jgi:hypothetical protein
MNTFSNIYHTKILHGNKIIENKIEYETPYEKKIIGIKNGKTYSNYLIKNPYFRKNPKHVTFRLKKRSPTPYYKNKKRYNKDCKTTRKIK